MDFTNYIEPKLLILVPVLYILGMFIKNSLIIKDKHIPLVLCIVSVVLAVLWLMATFCPYRMAKRPLGGVYSLCARGALRRCCSAHQSNNKTGA